MIRNYLSRPALIKGSITPSLLVIVASFAVAIFGILFVISQQLDFSHRQVASDSALAMAEAGVNYYRWHLLQDSTDFTSGTGIHDYEDPEVGLIGQFNLTVTPPAESSNIVTITSTGWTNRYPKVRRTIRVRYGAISLTSFSFLHNSNVWFGNGVTINGPVFSNGGIRQDGTNNSTVESSKEIYICGLETGCTNPEEKPGIWGNGEIDDLWSFPVKPIDFDSIKVDFSKLKAASQTNGLYLGPSAAQGYHIVFVDNGDFSVYKVIGVNSFKGYSIEKGCENLYQDITSETLLGTYQISQRNIVFAEDTVWVDGVVNGEITLVAARFPIGSFETNIWITNDLTYLAKDGNSRLGLIAQKDIIIGRDVPEYFDLHAAILAQNGRIIRHHYNWFKCSHSSDKMKNEFNFYGSLISNFSSYWNFSQGPQSPAAGFIKSTLDYDTSMRTDPPPYFPNTIEYRFISWEEVRE